MHCFLGWKVPRGTEWPCDHLTSDGIAVSYDVQWSEGRWGRRWRRGGHNMKKNWFNSLGFLFISFRIIHPCKLDEQTILVLVGLDDDVLLAWVQSVGSGVSRNGRWREKGKSTYLHWNPSFNNCHWSQHLGFRKHLNREDMFVIKKEANSSALKVHRHSYHFPNAPGGSHPINTPMVRLT